ncbi:L1 [Myotis ricketti papillomavirus 1]|uniref:Major capsid protein L1 n=1 Tax=Myotis ricketti papillomavirus 1 TaxID=1195370 RepID=I3VR49_9PAPI|nr:L1 [Myotis ricketti papillomavirus 1]AFK84994.1 L1 [Myotis ricketti papillomavirus 1]
MAFWRSGSDKLYLPPTAVSRVVSTDEYVTRMPYFYHSSSSRLLTIGNPYFAIYDDKKEVKVPKVSANQFRVFRVTPPDPNKFALPASTQFNPEEERLVWACVGVEVGRGQPLGIGLSGNPLFNKQEDSENPSKYNQNIATDTRQNVSIDNKQTQLFMMGCVPPLGEHWAKALSCVDNPPAKDDCPPMELVNSIIEDGDMIDTGFGAMDFRALQDNIADSPLDIARSVCKYPDYLKMAADQYGDALFFFIRREQMFARHFFTRAGVVGEPVPAELYLKAATGQNQETVGSSVYFPTASGSLVSSDSQIFNRPYWLQRAQGHNHGICWDNQLFLTVVDNTRGTNMTISVTSTEEQTYKATNFKQYLRHTEEYDIQLILQLCKVTLTTELLAYIHTMEPDILHTWNLGFQAPPNTTLEDTYRYLKSAATRCDKREPPKERVDKYEKFHFWNVDLSDKFSSDLDQFPLGRKFLQQYSLQGRPRTVTSKRSAPARSSTPAKRRRK